MTPIAANGPVAAFIPHVAEAAALEDRAWFDGRPERRFRARAGDGGVWLIRRLATGAEIFLRAFGRNGAAIRNDGDCDGELAALWCMAAYPDWSPEQVSKWARKALHKGGSPR
jgi:hypothetical protein